MKRIIAFLLCISMLFCAANMLSCSKEVATMGGHPVGKLEFTNNAVDYKFYYPDSWQTQMNNGMACLYVSSDDPSNVSVTKFGLGDDFKTLDEYISGLPHSFMNEWNAVFGQTDFGTPNDIKLGTADAKQYIYEVTISEVAYKYMQVFALYNDSIYTLTYAARLERFDTHLENVNAIIESFEFKD